MTSTDEIAMMATTMTSGEAMPAAITIPAKPK